MSFRKQTRLLLIILSGSLSFLTSCNKIPFPWGPSKGDLSYQDVYVAGFEGNRAVLWTNGVPRYLTDGNTPASATAVFVKGKDIYVAGSENGKAVIWKNGGTGKQLNGAATAKRIFMEGDDLYITGGPKIAAFYGIKAVVWKQGTVVYESTNSMGDVHSVFVSNGDFYAAGGYEADTEKGARYHLGLWKNNVRIGVDLDYDIIPFGYNAMTDVFIQGNDVYAVGVVDGSPIMWKNGIKSYPEYSVYAMPSSICVSNSDVFVVGYQTNENDYSIDETVFWKNGTQTIIPQMTYPGNPFIYNSTLFIPGRNASDKKAKLYVDGSTIDLTDGTQEAGANAVYVVKRQ